MKKVFIILSSLILLAGVIALTSASFDAKMKTQFHISLSKTIFLGVNGLDSTVLGYKSGKDISDFQLVSNCATQSKYLGSSNDIYFYQIRYTESCKNSTVVLQKDGLNIFDSLYTLKFFDTFDIYNKFTDYSSERLEEVLIDLNKKQRTLKAYENLETVDATSFIAIQKKRKYDEVSYISGIISSILESREYPYLIPIAGYSLPNQHSHLPNASRGYRKGYTDGIHHGWDIYAPNETPVLAIDSGLIVYVKSDFQYEDLKKIKKNDVSLLDEAKNLDIHRGNQVWLKTMKGEIVFYSHLEDIGDDINVGDFVSKGTTLGTTGVTGVPQIGYKDYHLHFAIQKNPYNIYKAGKYTREDYMLWDWLLKGLSPTEVREKQKDIFVK